LFFAETTGTTLASNLFAVDYLLIEKFYCLLDAAAESSTNSKISLPLEINLNCFGIDTFFFLASASPKNEAIPPFESLSTND